MHSKQLELTRVSFIIDFLCFAQKIHPHFHSARCPPFLGSLGRLDRIEVRSWWTQRFLPANQLVHPYHYVLVLLFGSTWSLRAQILVVEKVFDHLANGKSRQSINEPFTQQPN